MGKKKRSRSRSRSDTRRKLRKLEDKIRKYRRRYPSSSSSEGGENYSVHGPDVSGFEEYDWDYEEDLDENDDRRNDSQPDAQPPQGSPQRAPVPPLPVPGPSTAPDVLPVALTSVPQAQETSNPDDTVPSLDAEILQILGENPADQKSYGDNLHKDIAPRWAHILTNGLNNECKQDLIKQYLPAENCPNTKAPKLNLEIIAAMSEIGVKKDTYSQSKQNQLSGALSAIGKALNWAISSKDTVPQMQEVIKQLSDAARLICDCHYRESLARRYAIMNTLNKETRDAVKNTKIDEYLFGSNLADQLKSSKAITKSASEMKAAIVPRVPYKPPITLRQRGALNSRGATRAYAGEPRRNLAPRGPAPAAAPTAAPRDRPRRYEQHPSFRSSRARARRR